MIKSKLDPAVRKLLYRAFDYASRTTPVLVYDVQVNAKDKEAFAQLAKIYGIHKQEQQ